MKAEQQIFQTQSWQGQQCTHFQSLIQQKQVQNNAYHKKFQFIKPHIKGWLCLRDGCINVMGNHKYVYGQMKKINDPNHKILMEMSSLEIFCFQCNCQITDKISQDAKQLRKLALQVDKQQQKILFGASLQYPSRIQKQKEGLAGTIGTQLNSYINSVIQLLAHISPFYQICSQIDIKSLKNQCFKQIIRCINQIRSGVYRIVQTKKIQQLLKNTKRFDSYGKKTPSNFLLYVLSLFLQQFKYQGPTCKQKQILSAISLQIMNPEIECKTKYSPIKELFTGQFIWNASCQKCNSINIFRLQFECLRLESQINGSKIGTKIQQLIQYSFNLKNVFDQAYQKTYCNKKQCQKKKSKYKLNLQMSAIKFPNILLLQFIDQQGMNLQCPETIDLTKLSGNQKINQNRIFKYYYLGSISKGKNKRYFTHIKQPRENNLSKQFIFDDILIKEDAPRLNKVFYAVYKMQPDQKNKTLSKNIQSSILVNVQCYVPLPDFWNYYISQLKLVQPLVNPYICPHGFLAPFIKSKSSLIKKIPPSIYQYLVQQFGGRQIKLKNQNQFCSKCTQKINLLETLKKQEKQMAIFADQLSTKKSKVCIEIQWFQKWKKYLYETEINYYENEGNKRPGPINNRKGLQQNGQINQEKYKKISPQVWYFFKIFYGGGPLIAKNFTQPKKGLTQVVDVRYQKVKNIIEMISNKF